MTAKHTTNAFRAIKPLRLRIPKLVDILLVSDADQIAWLNEHPAVSRPIDPTRSWLHRFLDARLRTDLSLDGKPLPVFQPRSSDTACLTRGSASFSSAAINGDTASAALPECTSICMRWQSLRDHVFFASIC